MKAYRKYTYKLEKKIKSQRVRLRDEYIVNWDTWNAPTYILTLVKPQKIKMRLSCNIHIFLTACGHLTM